MARVLIIHSSLTTQVLLELTLERLGHTVVYEEGSTAGHDVTLVESSDPRSLARSRAVALRAPEARIVMLLPEQPSEDSVLAWPGPCVQYPYSAEELERAIGKPKA